MIFRERLREEEQYLYEILTDPIWCGEFLRSTNDMALTEDERKTARSFSYRWYQKDLLTDESNRVLLRGGRAIGKCHPKHTRIYTINGYMTIDEIVSMYGINYPFAVYSPLRDGTIGQRRAWITKSLSDIVYKITTERGHVLECSPDHPIYTDRGWMYAEDITTDHSVAITIRLPWKSHQQVFSWDELRWLGYVFGNPSTLPESPLILPYRDQVEEMAGIAARLHYRFLHIGESTYRLDYNGQGESPLRRLITLLDSRRLHDNTTLWIIPQMIMNESIESIKVFLESFLSQVITFDHPYGYIKLPFTYVGQRAFPKHLQELLLRFGVTATAITWERDLVILRTATPTDTARLFTVFSIPGFTVTSSTDTTSMTDIPYFSFDRVISVQKGTIEPMYSVEVEETQMYIAENMLVHNSVIMQDKIIYTLINAPKELPETREILLLTPNQNQLTPILDSIVNRMRRSPLLQGFIEAINLSKGTIDIRHGSLVYRLYARIAGSVGDTNVVGLHVPRIYVDEVQLLPYSTWLQLQPVLNHWERKTQLFIAGVPNGLRDGVLYQVDVFGSGWKKYAIPAPHNPYWTYKDHEQALRTYGGESSDEFQQLVLGNHGSEAFAVIRRDAMTVESYPFYSYAYTDRHRDQGIDYTRVIHRPIIPHDCSTFVLAVDTGYVDPTVIQLFGFHNYRWRVYIRWKLVRIPFSEQADIIHYIASHYPIESIAVDVGAGGGGLGIMHTMQKDPFPNASWYRQRIVGINFASVIDPVGDSKQGRVQAKSIGGEQLTQLIHEGILVFSHLDFEGIDELTRVSYQRNPDGSHRYFVLSPRGGKSGNDHIFASYLVFTIYLIQHISQSRARIDRLIRPTWV